MTDEVLSHLVRQARQQETDAVRLSQQADRQRSDRSRQRAAAAWREFELRWDAVRAYSDARHDACSGGPPSGSADNPIVGPQPGRQTGRTGRAGETARSCPSENADATPCREPRSGHTAGNLR